MNGVTTPQNNNKKIFKKVLTSLTKYVIISM